MVSLIWTCIKLQDSRRSKTGRNVTTWSDIFQYPSFGNPYGLWNKRLQIPGIANIPTGHILQANS